MEPTPAAAAATPPNRPVSLQEFLARPNVIVKGKYKVLEKISDGKYGVVCKGVNLADGKEIALKFDKYIDASTRKPRLRFESIVYRELNEVYRGKVVNMEWYGLFEVQRVLVMDLLGPSLRNLFDSNPESFSVKNVMVLAMEMVTCLEELHSIGFIHRDVKADNFCIGLGIKSGKVYLIDFGLAKRYSLDDSGPCFAFPGNLTFCSVSALRGMEQSRRDDLESLAYVLIYFLRRSLPWSNVYSRNCLMEASVETIFQDVPDEMLTYLKYVKGLEFKAEPDYKWIRKLFAKALTRLNPGKRLDDLLRLDWKSEPAPEENAVAY